MGDSWIKREFTDAGLTQYPVGSALRALQGRLGDSGESAVLDAPTPEPPPDTGALEADGERAVLMALYKSTNGRNWIWNTATGKKPAGTWRWDGRVPVGHWGATTNTNRAGHLTDICLLGHGVRGKTPPELSQLTYLINLNLNDRGGRFSEKVPTVLGQLTNLIHLILHCDGLSGPIPPEVGQLTLTNLHNLDLQSDSLSGP